jgi:hypothetical protein
LTVTSPVAVALTFLPACGGGGPEAAGVLNVASSPSLVPFALFATIRKWYVVAGFRPDIDADSGWVALSVPAEAVPVLAP